jgi:hypothetical protein
LYLSDSLRRIFEAVLGAAIGPETRDVDLAADAEFKAADGDALAGSLVGIPYAHGKNDS